MSTTDTTCGNCEGIDPASCLVCGPRPDAERDERLRGIQERVERATVGPWEIRGIEIVRDSEGLPTIQALWVADIDPVSSDAAFIAAARTDVPWLLAEVARQAAVIQAVRDLHQPRRVSWDPYPTCDECGYMSDDEDDPCPTRRALDEAGATCHHQRLTTYEDPNHRAWVCQHCGVEGTEDKT